MLDQFREVVVVDFEFEATPGDRPVPLCLVAHEQNSGRKFRVWQDEFGRSAPYATGADILLVAYLASAELSCYLALGWPMPERVLDLYVEFRARCNGLQPIAGFGLLGAMAQLGLDTLGADTKADMQQAIGRG